MPTLRSTLLGAWNVNVATLRFIGRVGVGLLGVWWLIGGVIGTLVAVAQLALLSVIGGGLTVFIGWSLAYGAFHHWPWESFPVRDPTNVAGDKTSLRKSGVGSEDA